MTRFIDNIQSPVDSEHNWPIIKTEHDHCGQWIEREKQEQVFGQEGLEYLDKVHIEFHAVASAIQHKCQNGETEAARDSLAELKIAFDKMSNYLGMCE